MRDDRLVDARLPGRQRPHPDLAARALLLAPGRGHDRSSGATRRRRPWPTRRRSATKRRPRSPRSRARERASPRNATPSSRRRRRPPSRRTPRVCATPQRRRRRSKPRRRRPIARGARKRPRRRGPSAQAVSRSISRGGWPPASTARRCARAFLDWLLKEIRDLPDAARQAVAASGATLEASSATVLAPADQQRYGKLIGEAFGASLQIVVQGRSRPHRRPRTARPASGRHQ